MLYQLLCRSIGNFSDGRCLRPTCNDCRPASGHPAHNPCFEVPRPLQAVRVSRPCSGRSRWFSVTPDDTWHAFKRRQDRPNTFPQEAQELRSGHVHNQ